MTNKVVSHLMKVCVEKNLHPTELQSYVRRECRKGKWRGENPSHLLLETQRRLNENYKGEGFLNF